MLGIGEYLSQYILVTVFGIIAFFAIIKYIIDTPSGGLFWDRLKLNIPKIKKTTYNILCLLVFYGANLEQAQSDNRTLYQTIQWLQSSKKTNFSWYLWIKYRIKDLNFAFSTNDQALRMGLKKGCKNIEAIDGDNDLMFSS